MYIVYIIYIPYWSHDESINIHLVLQGRGNAQIQFKINFGPLFANRAQFQNLPTIDELKVFSFNLTLRLLIRKKIQDPRDWMIST